MSYYVDGEPVWNSDNMWELLKAGGELELPALALFAFGDDVADEDLLADLNQLRNHMDSEHELIGLVDGAISVLHQKAQG